MASERIVALGVPIKSSVYQAHPRSGGLYLSERRALLFLGDISVLSLALLAALCVRLIMTGGAPQSFAAPWHWWGVLLALWLPLAIIVRCYDLKCAANTIESAVRSASLAMTVSALYLVVPVISAPLTSSRLSWFAFALLATLGTASWRLAYGRLTRERTFNRRVLVVGAGDGGRALAEALNALGDGAGVQLLGFVDDDPALRGQTVANRPVLGSSDRLLALAETLSADEIVMAMTDAAEISPALMSILEACWGRGIAVKPVQLYFEEITGAVMVQHIGQNLFVLMNQQNVALQRLWDAARRLADIVLGITGILLLAPFLPVIALAIYLDSRGPIFYRQERVGWGGQIFRVVKFRSMIPNAEPNGAVWASDGDDRITRVGRFLRKTRIDELPQLWNLLRGSMTLIGPRPERPEFVHQLDSLLPYYTIRHYIKPGLTGWAQVRYHYGNSVDDALLKLQYDLYYVKRRGPILDVIILLHTVRVVLQMQGT